MPYCGAPFIKSRKQSNQLLRQSSLTTPMPSASAFPSAATYSQLNNKYDQIEDLSYDKVDSRVYLYYIDALGIAPICIALIFYAAYQVFEVASKLWLSAWASTKSPEDMEGKLTNARFKQNRSIYYVAKLYNLFYLLLPFNYQIQDRMRLTTSQPMDYLAYFSPLHFLLQYYL